jgi:hypothetical protein
VKISNQKLKNMNMLFLLFFLSFSLNSKQCKIDINTTVLNPSCPQKEEDELFKIKSDCDLSYSKTVIYNRYGNIVFEEVNSNNGFDGTNGKKQFFLDGTYFYLIKYQTLENLDTLQISGYLQINR